MSNNYYITTPIYYVNDKPHIGHAYTSLACDVMCRFQTLAGYDTYFLTGTDEHGQKIEQAADKNNITPQQLVDKFSDNFKQLANIFNIKHDDFIRTTEPRHKQAVQVFWQKLQEKERDLFRINIAVGMPYVTRLFTLINRLRPTIRVRKSPLPAVRQWNGWKKRVIFSA